MDLCFRGEDPFAPHPPAIRGAVASGTGGRFGGMLQRNMDCGIGPDVVTFGYTYAGTVRASGYQTGMGSDGATPTWRMKQYGK